ncbi:MAG: Ig-like domain repeat protein, partial [Burkholderiaceae bacterium]
KFADSPADAFTPAAVQQVMVSNSNSVANYYSEVSFGQQLLNVTVTSAWLQAGVATPASCDFTAVGNLADSAASAAGYVLGNYKNRFYVMPYNPTCGWIGLAYVGFPYQAWSNGYNQLFVYGHELGHNFNLWHAGSLTCTGQVIGGSCGVAEYGDPFDIMGNISAMHFNAMQKSVLNWIPATSVKTHASGTATYTLSPIESPGQSTYAVKIPAASNRTYWLEYRQPIGFDSGMASYPNNGAQIRVATPFQFPCTSCGGDDTQILDMTLGTPGNFGDAALLVGQTYTDSTYGISVNVVSATASALTLFVSVGGSGTSTSVASSANPSTVGASVTFTATVNGNGPTGSVNFTDGGSSIAGCSASPFTGGTTNARTATCSTSSLAAGTHNVAAIYSGDGGNGGSTSPTLSQGVNKPATTTTLASSGSPATIGTLVTFTATVIGINPTGSVNFTDGGTTITGCGAAALTGVGNTRTATCSSSTLSAGTHSIVGSYSGDAGNTASTSPPLSQVISASGSSNVALASAGAVASASSNYSAGYPVASLNNNERAGANWGNGGGWAAANAPPGWVQIDFNGSKTIDRVVVYTLQDGYGSPVEPSDTLTFSVYGITDFTIQGWNGSSWVTLGTVSGNNLVKRTVTFTAFTTNQIRVNVTGSLLSVPAITEIEAWGN